MAGPLNGINVLSFGRMLSGPYAGMLLSDLGASVIKIEEPLKGDFARETGPFIEDVSSYFLSVNRGKKSLTLDLKSEEGREITFNLVKKVDILIENFRPGVMDRLGFSYEVMSQLNPRIIYASISGFGQHGLYAQRPAFDMIAQAMGGVVSITGETGRPPVRVGYSIGDIGAALFAVIAILAALSESRNSGQGQYIDISMLNSQMALCENAFTRYFATGEVPIPFGSRHPIFTPFQIFPTKNGYITLICFRPEAWHTFCKIAGREEWLRDERFESNEARLANYDEFERNMNELMSERSTEEWLMLFDSNGIISSPVNNIENLANDPHVLRHNMIKEVLDKRKRKMKVIGTPMKFSRTQCEIEKASPELGEHTDEILTGEVGLTPEKISNLRKLKRI